MLEVYSSDINVAAGATIPLYNITVDKGMSAVLSAPATIALNRCGVYNVHLDGFAEAADAGTITVQMIKNGVPQPQAITSSTGAFGFDTLVQVTENNTCCCCTSPTTLQFINSGAAVTGMHINVTVTKNG